jgi:hypothetical protein
MAVVVGAPRSGTTLLRLMLDAHPELAIPPETGFLAAAAGLKGEGDSLRRALFELITQFPQEAPAWADFGIAAGEFEEALARIEPFTCAAGVRAFYRLYAERQGKTRYGDKTPGHAKHLAAIENLLPEAHFIHLIRDGRDVALSWREQWFAPGREIETLAREWQSWVRAARERGARCRRYLEVRYEELIQEPRAALARICTFLELEFDEAMLAYYERSPQRLAEHVERRRVDGSLVVSREDRLRQQARTMQPPDCERVFAWRREMSSQEQARFMTVAGGLLGELGYEGVVKVA